MKIARELAIFCVQLFRKWEEGMFLEVNDPVKKASYTGACDGGEEENGKYDGSWLDKYIP